MIYHMKDQISQGIVAQRIHMLGARANALGTTRHFGASLESARTKAQLSDHVAAQPPDQREGRLDLRRGEAFQQALLAPAHDDVQ
jgi:hypothetical protein